MVNMRKCSVCGDIFEIFDGVFIYEDDAEVFKCNGCYGDIVGESIRSWRVLREDGKNCAWVNDRYIGVVTDGWVEYLERACPTSGAVDLAAPSNPSGAAQNANPLT